MRDVVDYYEQTGNESERHDVGQLYWAMFPIMPESRQCTRIGPAFLCTPYDVTRFNPGEEGPDVELGTESDEFLATVKYQMRPVVILAPKRPSHEWESRGKHSGDMCLVAPSYTVYDEVSSRYKYNKPFIWRAIAYYYNSVFYLEPSEDYNVKESIVRFDRVCSLHTSWLVQPRAVKLTESAFGLMQEWFRYYLTNIPSQRFLDDISALRSLLAETYEEAREHISA